MVTRQRKLIMVLAGMAALALVYSVAGGKGGPAAAPAGGQGQGRSAADPELPRVGLERVSAAEVHPVAGQRDVFAFGPEPRVEQPEP